jgi:hypothetical protein
MVPPDSPVPEKLPERAKDLRELRIQGISWLVAVVVGVAILAGLAGVLAKLLVPRGSDEPLPPLKGHLDVRIEAPGNPERLGLRLSQEGALPLRANDQVRVEVELNRPAFLYLIWIDSAGHATPLYPWRSGRWGRRPDLERALARLSLPDDRKGGWELAGSEPGMETVLLLARAEVLPADIELASLLIDLPKPRAQNPQAAVWFENGAVVGDEAERALTSFDPKDRADPVLQMQGRLTETLQPYFSYLRAVSFANAGK